MSDWEIGRLHWLTNQGLIPVLSLGLGESLLAPRNFSEGLTGSLVTIQPRSLTVSLPDWDLFLLSTMPALELREMSLLVSMKFSAWLVTSVVMACILAM